jgi:glycosyltransferase involved in cell wall biosynthesis
MDISIVIPVMNEEESIVPLYEAIVKEMEEIGISFEIIFVNDGSTDRSLDMIRDLNRRDSRVKAIDFRRNYGQTAALSAGFHYAKGEIIVSMDGDLQNDPSDIPKLLSKLNEGYDMVSGWRRKRKEPFLSRRIPSIVANWLIRKITGINIHDYGCTLKAYRSEIVKDIELYGEMHRFIPALASWMGAKIGEIPVIHHSRRFGKTKYGFSRVIRVIMDLITVKFLMSYSTRPLHIFGIPGIVSFLLGLAISGYLTFLKIFYNERLSQRPLVLLGILLIFMGVQFISMGLLAEIQIRTYHESQRKPIYTIREIIE